MRRRAPTAAPGGRRARSKFVEPSGYFACSLAGRGGNDAQSVSPCNNRRHACCAIGAGRRMMTWDFYETGITACEAFACVQPAGPQFLMSLCSPVRPRRFGGICLRRHAGGDRPGLYLRAGRLLFLHHRAAQLRLLSAWLHPRLRHHLGRGVRAAGRRLGGLPVGRLRPDVGYYVGGFGLTGGGIGSDGSFGGCSDGSCTVAGYWRNAAAVREPGSAVLLTSALVVFGLARFRRRRPSLLGP